MRKVEYFLIVIVCIFVAFISPIFNKEHTVELGSTSDIVSAFCNIVMAGAAVYAAFKAMDWFNSKKSGLAFDQAFSTLTEFDKLKIKLDRFHIQLTISNKKSIKLKEIHESCKDEIDSLQLSILAFIRSLNSTERLGFEIKSEIKENIGESFSSYINLVEEIFSLKNASPEMSSLYIHFNTQDKLFAQLEAIHKQTDNIEKMLKKNIIEIFDFNPS